MHNLYICHKQQESCLSAKRRHPDTPKGSYTVEAAVVIPIFVTLCVFALLFLRILQVEWMMETAMRSVAENVAVYGSADSLKDADEAQQLSEAGLIAATDAKVLSLGGLIGYVDGGILGINYDGSGITDEDAVIKASYRITLPVGLLGTIRFPVSQEVRYRRWTGYDPNPIENEDERYVYVARFGDDYHYKRDCTYLAPSVRAVMMTEVSALRNSGGHKYSPCSLCAKNKSGGNGAVYLTTYGTTYHFKSDCSALKRTIYEMPLSEAVDSYRPCPKCVSD